MSAVTPDIRLDLGVRILLLAATAMLFGALLAASLAPVVAWVAVLLTGLMLVLQMVDLWRLIEGTRTTLQRFVSVLRGEEDAPAEQPERVLVEEFDALGSALDDVLTRLHQVRARQQEQGRYLEAVVTQVPVGVVAFRPDGAITLLNRAARLLLTGGTAEQPPRSIDELAPEHPDLMDLLQGMADGEQGLVKLQRPESLPVELNVSKTTVRLERGAETLVSLQDISRELEAKELESWQNLIQVLTHEIMNSVTPVTSLASTAHGLLDELADDLGDAASGRVGGGLDWPSRREVVEDARDALSTIAERGQGLLTFVDNYRRLTRLPIPVPSRVSVREALAQIRQLMGPELEARGIAITVEVEPSELVVDADPDLFQQVLINLTRNAMEAFGNDARTRESPAHISLRARREGAETRVQVEDTGMGIGAAELDQIFVPFFTTKDKGSGVGLSLVRQVMRMHGGSVNLSSRPGEGTCVTLHFPNALELGRAQVHDAAQSAD